MTRRNMTILAAVAIAAVLSPTATSAAKVPIDVFEVGCMLDLGTQWLSNNGKELHVRGQLHKDVFFDSQTFEVLGQNSLVANVATKTRTGKTRLCGTFSGLFLPHSQRGTFDGTWNAKIGARGLVGRAIGHGTFTLEGQKIKLSLQGLAPEMIPTELVEILAQSPWTECAEITGVSRVTGFIRTRPEE